MFSFRRLWLSMQGKRMKQNSAIERNQEKHKKHEIKRFQRPIGQFLWHPAHA